LSKTRKPLNVIHGNACFTSSTKTGAIPDIAHEGVSLDEIAAKLPSFGKALHFLMVIPSYGQLLILNAGGGYHVLLAGMERISVDLGQFVLTGEPVAVMGGGSQVSASVATRSKQPVLYVEFRKDGAPIDPSPWWATNEGEKVRG